MEEASDNGQTNISFKESVFVMNKPDHTALSACHKASVTIGGDGGEGTHYYVCSQCHKACDLYVDHTEEWLVEILHKHFNVKDLPKDELVRFTLQFSKAKASILAHEAASVREADRKTLETIAAILNGDDNQVETAKAYIRNKLAVLRDGTDDRSAP